MEHPTIGGRWIRNAETGALIAADAVEAASDIGPTAPVETDTETETAEAFEPAAEPTEES